MTFALGATDYSSQGTDSAVFDLEYRYKPFYERQVLSVALGANGSVTEEGDLFVGVGVWGRWQWQSGWFVDLSVMPGFYEDNGEGNDLGGNFHFRSLLGAGYRFDNGHALSATISHKSNAEIEDFNPGTNTYSLRYHISF